MTHVRPLAMLVATVFLVGCSATGDPPAAGERRAWDGQVQVHGALRAMFHEGQTGTMVSLDSLLPSPELYAVGALADLSGEVTVIDGRAYLAFPDVAEGARTELTLRTDAGATLLVAAAVPAWNSFVTDRAIRFEELDAEIGRLAVAAGLRLNPHPLRPGSAALSRTRGSRRHSRGDHGQVPRRQGTSGPTGQCSGPTFGRPLIANALG